MRLSEAAELEPRKPKRDGCGVARIRAGMDDDDRETFDRLLSEAAKGDRTAASISRILGHAGIVYKPNNIGHHLRRDCSCWERDSG